METLAQFRDYVTRTMQGSPQTRNAHYVDVHEYLSLTGSDTARSLPSLHPSSQGGTERPDFSPAHEKNHRETKGMTG